MLNTLKEFTNIGCYPIKLARLIGVSEAALLYDIIKLFNNNRFRASDLTKLASFSTYSFEHLTLKDLVYNDGDLFYKVNLSKLEIILSPVIKNDPTPTHNDPVFVNYCIQWQKVLKDKNRNKSIKEIYSLFEGKTLEHSIDALNRAISNKHVTLFFNEKLQTTIGRVDGNGGIGRKSGGSKNSGDVGDKAHPTRSPSEF